MIYLLAILALGVLIIIHEGGHFLVARLSGMRVERFSIGFGPPLTQFERGGTIFQIGYVPLGGFVQIAGLNPQDDHVAADDPRSYPNRPVYQRLATIFAGPGMNYLFAAVMMAVVYAAFGVPVPGKLPMVTELVDGAPAQAAGLQLGDEVVSVDGHAVKDFNDVGPIIDASKGRLIEVMVKREGETQPFKIAPRKDGDRYRIGIGIQPREVFVRAPLARSIAAGLIYPYEVTRAIFHNFALIFRGKQKAEFSGPVGIVKVLKGQIARGAAEGLSMVAFISVLLGLFNLLTALMGALVLVRYRAAIPLMFLLLLIQQLGARALLMVRPVVPEDSAAGASTFVLIVLGVTVVGFVLSLLSIRRRDA